MKTRIALVGLFIALLPAASVAAPAKSHSVNPHSVKAMPKATKATVMYECSKCHMRVSAAVAKKDHFKDSMDGGTFVPVKTAKK